MHNPLFLCVYFAVFGAIYLFAFKRQIELISAQDKLKQFASAGCVILMFAGMFLLPGYTFTHTLTFWGTYFGVFLAIQYFFVNKSLVAVYTVPPGLWVPSLLKLINSPEIRSSPATNKQIKAWLALLHEYGLVAPPCKRDDLSTTVRLRIRMRYHLWETMTWRIDSSLQINSEGMVSCVISPRDYIVLAQRFGADELPGRQELGMRLSRSFTRAFGVYADGGDKVAVADALGLAQCPLDVTKTYRFLILKYLMPLAGVLLIAGTLLYRLL